MWAMTGHERLLIDYCSLMAYSAHTSASSRTAPMSGLRLGQCGCAHPVTVPGVPRGIWWLDVHSVIEAQARRHDVEVREPSGREYMGSLLRVDQTSVIVLSASTLETQCTVRGRAQHDLTPLDAVGWQEPIRQRIGDSSSRRNWSRHRMSWHKEDNQITCAQISQRYGENIYNDFCVFKSAIYKTCSQYLLDNEEYEKDILDRSYSYPPCVGASPAIITSTSDTAINNIAVVLRLVQQVANVAQCALFLGPVAAVMAEILKGYKEVKDTNEKLLTKTSAFIKDYNDHGLTNHITARNELRAKFAALTRELDSFGARFRSNRLVDLVIHQRVIAVTVEDTTITVMAEKLEKWLDSPPNMKRKQSETLQLCKEGTGLWLLEGKMFQQWQDIQDYCGSKGIVFKDLPAKNAPRSPPVAFFYFDFRTSEGNPVETALWRCDWDCCAGDFECNFKGITRFIGSPLGGGGKMRVDHLDGTVAVRSASYQLVKEDRVASGSNDYKCELKTKLQVG
ncbi:hypothetical protein FB451DRAFT_1538243 [Mycena latifolia]|nr:hypothetical protein FB451DRAFT_1538243 [Mycena latifolia]